MDAIVYTSNTGSTKRYAERRAKTQLRAAKLAHGALPCRRREGRHVPHGRKRSDHDR